MREQLLSYPATSVNLFSSPPLFSPSSSPSLSYTLNKSSVVTSFHLKGLGLRVSSFTRVRKVTLGTFLPSHDAPFATPGGTESECNNKKRERERNRERRKMITKKES